MKISVVIPAYNEARYIGRCLESLSRQTLPREQYEVVVVDNGSTDATPEIVRQTAAIESFHLRLISRPKVSISAVRNLGAAATSGELLAFLDADCIPDPDWLASALRLAPASGLWGAHYRIPQDATWVGRTWFRYQATPYDGNVTFLPGGDMFVHRADFDAVGGFEEAVRTSEDVDLCARVRRAGMPVVAMPALGVVHLGTPRTLGGFYRQNRWHGQEVLRLFLKNLPSTKHLSIILLSVATLLLFWLTFFGTFYALYRHTWYFFLAPFLLLLLLPLLLAARKCIHTRSIRSFVSLFALYLTYFLARAAALRHIIRLTSLAERGRTKS